MAVGECNADSDSTQKPWSRGSGTRDPRRVLVPVRCPWTVRIAAGNTILSGRPAAVRAKPDSGGGL